MKQYFIIIKQKKSGWTATVNPGFKTIKEAKAHAARTFNGSWISKNRLILDDGTFRATIISKRVAVEKKTNPEPVVAVCDESGLPF